MREYRGKDRIETPVEGGRGGEVDACVVHVSSNVCRVLDHSCRYLKGLDKDLPEFRILFERTGDVQDDRAFCLQQLLLAALHTHHTTNLNTTMWELYGNLD